MSSVDKTWRIGFVGLGDQGAPMARAVADAGWPLSVWARRSSTFDAVADIPHTACETLDDLGRTCDVIGLCLRDDDDVEEVLVERGLLRALQPGAIVVNHGTGSPDVCAAWARLGAERG